MTCQYLKDDTLHTLSSQEQQDHLKSCVQCRQNKDFEDRIMTEAARLKPYQPEPALWDTIEKSLQQKPATRNNIHKMMTATRFWLSAAAIVIVMLTASVFYLFFGGSDKILSDGALVRVELTEQNYLEAIRELEARADQKMTDMDIELMLLYRDKLETIDRQISHCQQAIKNNPGNAHIRRYMLAALQDKKETLSEILKS